MMMSRLINHVARSSRRVVATSSTATMRCIHVSTSPSLRKASVVCTSRLTMQSQRANFSTISDHSAVTANSDAHGAKSLDLWHKTQDLYVRALAQDALAQYELGLMYLDDDVADDDSSSNVVEDEWTLDAETLRQRASSSSPDLQDIKSIRKHARKLYKEYKQSTQKSATISPLVARTTSADLDDVYGSITQPWLDGSRLLAPLSSESEVDDTVIMQVLGGSNQAKGVEWLRRAADNGHRDAFVRLGNLCMAHDPPLVHAARAWYSVIAFCEKPHPDALYNLGMLLYDDHPTAVPTPTVANLPLAMDCFMKAAEVGDPSAQFFMGHVLHVGNESVAANPVSSRMLLEQAATQGHGGALYYLAQLHLSGAEAMHVPVDLDKALTYLRLAVDEDEADALVCMADMYREGLPPVVPVDVQAAHDLYERAAAMGHPEALCTLGALAYANRLYEPAFQYYQAAADRHSMAAWKNLADMYYAGVGVPQNKKTAESILDMLRKMDTP
ncbi:hypothetical protein H257_03753 [Aphanomyces astaci]|uniref:Uncharacterized protein n=2 Tax=Aphanomyces astaci TaxID=112090 RepID=W4GZ46_APHAT|nr:hypothetical protein H257_03753 [Aphanomyces astaci]ETV84586.1 hypothetical protein H257_03753 [Aphanomyces astaci]|eukprot:XP_009826278.1 hypothetical protein H257_03753 [Aphanomyces astaci]